MIEAHFVAVAVSATFSVAVLALGVVAVIEHIVTKRQIEELNGAHGGMKVATSWLSCRAMRGISNTRPEMESEHVSVVLPEIVLCRDCEFYTADGLDGWCTMLDFEHAGYVEPDGYCSLGERRSE